MQPRGIVCFSCGWLAAVALTAQSIGYQYDSLKRLVQASYPDGTMVSFSYDAAGNRLSQVITTAPVASPISVNQITLTFYGTAGEQSTAAQTLTIQSQAGATPQWTANPSVPWLSVTPASGVGTGSVSVTASAANLTAGKYAGAVVVISGSSQVLAPVLFLVTQGSSQPSISKGIFNAASYGAAIARGSIASVFGTSLANSTAGANNVPLPTALAGTSVTVNGIPAPLFFVSPTEVRFQIPFECPLSGSVPVSVSNNGSPSATTTLQLQPYAPGIFTYQRAPGVVDPIIIGPDLNLVSPSDPAHSGDTIYIAGTGIGDLTILPQTGAASPSAPPAQAKLNPTITIGGIAAQGAAASLTAGAIGMAQFSAVVPSGLPKGNSLPLMVSFGSASSQVVQLYVAQTNTGNGPTIQTLAPPSATAGSQAMAVTINGTGFASGGTVRWTLNGSTTNLTSTFVSSTAITAQVSASLLVSPGSAQITVANPSGAISGPAAFTIEPATTSTANIMTIGGNGSQGYWGDTGPATNAILDNPTGLAFDNSGDFFIADAVNNRVRKVTPNGTIATVAGNGSDGYSGDGGPATSATLSVPSGVAVDVSGNLYIADTLNNRIRKVTPDGNITTFAGNVTHGYSGDGASASAAELAAPVGVAVDAASNVYIADTDNHRIRMVAPNGTITTVAGNGVQGYLGDGLPAAVAELNQPRGIAVDSKGDLFIADSGNQVVRLVASGGVINTLAGTGAAGYSGDGGPATGATLFDPSGVAVDATGVLYVADASNSVVRRVDPGGTIWTVAGNDTAGYSGDGGPAINAQLDTPSGVAVDTAGNVYIADTNNSVVRMLIPQGTEAVLRVAKSHSGSFAPGQTSATYSVVVSNSAGTATSGLVTVTDTIPAGLTLVSIAGSGWSCSNNVCTRADALNLDSSYPPITVTVSVSANASAPVVNQVSVSGGSSPTSTAADPTLIATTPPPLQVTFAASPNPIISATGVGVTTLTWNAPGYSQLAIFVGTATGNQLTGTVGSSGSATTGDWVTDGMQFFLVDLTSQSSLASVTVHVRAPNALVGTPADASDLFGGPPYCNFSVTMSGMDLAIDTTVMAATLTGIMTESALDNCPYPPIPQNAHTYSGIATIFNGSVTVLMAPASTNAPQANAQFTGNAVDGRLVGTLTITRTDEGPPLNWTVTSQVK